MAKLIHFQGYPPSLLSLTVPGIPSMHICLDFVPQLLNQPHLEKQVRIQPTGKKRLLAHTSKFKPDTLSVFINFLTLDCSFLNCLKRLKRLLQKADYWHTVNQKISLKWFNLLKSWISVPQRFYKVSKVYIKPKLLKVTLFLHEDKIFTDGV